MRFCSLISDNRSRRMTLMIKVCLNCLPKQPSTLHTKSLCLIRGRYERKRKKNSKKIDFMIFGCHKNERKKNTKEREWKNAENFVFLFFLISEKSLRKNALLNNLIFFPSNFFFLKPNIA